MKIKDIILYILIILVIYLIYKTRKSENFSLSAIKADVIAEVNNKYKTELDTMNVLADLSKKILDEKNELIIPTKLTQISDAYINGTLGVANVATFYNNIDIPYKNNSLLDIFPAYMIIMWPKAIPPKGWAICNGKRYRINADGIAYETLEPPQISTDNKQTVIVLQTPDLRERCVVGAGLSNTHINSDGTIPGFTNKILGHRAGQENVTLTIDTMPSHTHDHNMWQSGDDDCGNSNVFDCGKGGSKSGVSIGRGGGIPRLNPNDYANASHNNLQPYYVLNFIMKF
jgi:microcystin-dependent protein